MAYASDKKPGELTELTSLATDDVFVVGDTSDASEVAKYITKANLITDLAYPGFSITVTSGNVGAGSTAKTHYVYLVAGAHTVTLPTAVGNTSLYSIKNNHSTDISIATTSSQTIDGTVGITVAAEDSVTIVSNGANWFII